METFGTAYVLPIVAGPSFSPDGSLIAAAHSGVYGDHAFRLWDVASGRILLEVTGHAGKVTGLSFSPDGRSIVSSSLDGTLILWKVDLESGGL